MAKTASTASAETGGLRESVEKFARRRNELTDRTSEHSLGPARMEGRLGQRPDEVESTMARRFRNEALARTASAVLERRHLCRRARWTPAPFCSPSSRASPLQASGCNGTPAHDAAGNSRCFRVLRRHGDWYATSIHGCARRSSRISHQPGLRRRFSDHGAVSGEEPDQVLACTSGTVGRARTARHGAGHTNIA